eukprot:621328-Ditylum_brightwellii.AAC.1
MDMMLVAMCNGWLRQYNFCAWPERLGAKMAMAESHLGDPKVLEYGLVGCGRMFVACIPALFL